MQLAQAEGMEVAEINLVRESLYTADELFLCGTAAEITPVTSVDRIQVGDGTPGPISRSLQATLHTNGDGRLRGCVWLADPHEPVLPIRPSFTGSIALRCVQFFVS